MIHITVNPNDILDSKAMLQKLKIPFRTLRQATTSGDLQPHPIGAKDYFIGDEIIEWLRGRSKA